MQWRWQRFLGIRILLLIATMAASGSLAHAQDFSVLSSFEAPAPVTFTSQLGSQPDTRPILGPGNTVLGMTYNGGLNGTGVIYKYDLRSHEYTLLHTFSALDSNGNNKDGAGPGDALTRGPDDVFYGMASLGGENGSGTIFKFTASGEFTVLHTFSALDANGNNEDGAYPLRQMIISADGNLYGTTRFGGLNACTLTSNGCGVAWVMDLAGHNFKVLHQFNAAEGHAAAVLQAKDGLLYGCAVWPAPSLNGIPLPSGILYRMAPSGQNFQVLYTFSQMDANGNNSDGAGCYEPLFEAAPGVFYSSTTFGGTNGNGVVFRYSLSDPTSVEIVHTFSASTAGENWDGAYPGARLSPGPEGALYSTASYGGMYGNGVVYRVWPNGDFEVLHTFSATDPTTGANEDGATPDYGVVVDDHDQSLIGMTDYGGNGSSAGFFNSGGTLYQLKIEDSAHRDDH